MIEQLIFLAHSRSRPPSQSQNNEGRVTRATAPRFTHWQGVPAAADESDVGDDRSIHSFESAESGSRLSTRRGRRPISFNGSFASNHSSPHEAIVSSPSSATGTLSRRSYVLLEQESNQYTAAQQNWWSTKPSSSHDAVQAAILDSSSYPGHGSSSDTAQAPAQQVSRSCYHLAENSSN